VLHSTGRMDKKDQHPHPVVIASKGCLPLAKVIVVLSCSESSSCSYQLKLQRLQEGSGEGMERHPRAIDRASLWLPEDGHHHTGAMASSGEKRSSTAHYGSPSTPSAFLVKACVAPTGPWEV